MGPLPETDDGNLYIIVLWDYFSKWTEAYVLKNHTAPTITDIIMEQFVSGFGVPKSVHSDQGREFESDLIAALCKLLHIHKTRTVPYNPKSDGLVERSNRTVIQMLTALVGEARNDWDDHLPYVMMAYWASVHESTNFTPNRLMLNHETNLPIDLMIGSPPETPTCPVHYVEWVKETSEHAFEFVQHNLQASAERQKKLCDRKGGLPKFSAGDSVWRYNPPKARLKFGKGWEGPYLITAKVNPLCYCIQMTSKSRSIVVHVDHLKFYEGKKPVKSWLATSPGVVDGVTDPKQHEGGLSASGDGDMEDVNGQDRDVTSLLSPGQNDTCLSSAGSQDTEHHADTPSKLPGADHDETIPFSTGSQHSSLVTDNLVTSFPMAGPSKANDDESSTTCDPSDDIASPNILDPLTPKLHAPTTDNSAAYNHSSLTIPSGDKVNTNKQSLSGMTNPTGDELLPLAFKRTRRPLKPRDILDL